jgi:alkylation response protein AidB-like acyl-CoA dehydrogenase
VQLFGSEAQKQRLLPAFGSGEKIGALAIAESPGPLNSHAIKARFEDDKLTGTKIAVTDGMVADLLVVAALNAGEPQLFVVEATAPGMTRAAKTGIDPSHPPAALHFENAPAEQLGDAGWTGIRQLLDRAAVLVAFEQIGTADAALALAAAYAKERKAFGRVIGSFQAIKHKLADMWIAIELARANAYYAAWALATDADALTLAAATARVSASEALERAARELIQVHGGIGATWEHDAHLYYRRGQHLAVLLGGLHEWHDRLTEELGIAA